MDMYIWKNNTNEAAESKDGKEYQAISAPAQINKTMNDSGKSFTIDAKITRGNGNLTYETTNEKIATVKDGKVTIVGRGKCNIVIKASETKEYKETEEKRIDRKQEEPICIQQRLWTTSNTQEMWER